MNKIFWLAYHTCTDILRQRILYTVAFFAIVLIVTGSILGTAAPGQKGMVVTDIGLGAINIFSVLIAVVMGVNLLYQELDRRTVYNILAKPLGRGQFVIGKYFGLLAAVFVVFAGMVATLYVAALQVGSIFSTIVYQAMGNMLWEVAMVSAVAILFSSFSTPYLSGLFTLGIWMIGSMTTDLWTFQYIANIREYRRVVEAVFFILPDFSALNLKDRVPYASMPGLNMQPPPGYLLHSALYALAWSAGLICLAVVIFRQRDFK